ncbi:hypothetical protein GCM10023185_10390 [Hymenobacter saemangeumensis]|uniref:CinA C-terminal domain-containing protein n=1 Tax=Hymenobacter saemangeumensis TaxID=1084522 RepID=A0ABP8I5N8_9BACT
MPVAEGTAAVERGHPFEVVIGSVGVSQEKGGSEYQQVQHAGQESAEVNRDKLTSLIAAQMLAAKTLLILKEPFPESQ